MSGLAYLDPASGSLILQVIVGGVAAVAVMAKMWWRRTLDLLRIRGRSDPSLAPPIPEASEAPIRSPVREKSGPSARP